MEEEKPFVQIDNEKVYLDGDYKVGPVSMSDTWQMVQEWSRDWMAVRRVEMDEFVLKVKTGDPGALFLLLLTLFLSILVMVALFESLFPPPAPKKTDDEEPEVIVQRDFTIEQLRECNGENGKPIYIGLKGDVYDVSRASDLYGPGNAYHLFAGRDTTRSMAKLSFEEEDLANPDISGLNPFEKDALDDWIHKFKYYKQYPIVGKLSYPTTGNTFTLADLAKCNGSETPPEGRINSPILVSVCGEVFDVSYGGFEWYGPEGPYARFAGKEIARALAKMSFEEADIESSDLSDLDEKQQKTLRDWQHKFLAVKKYPVVGKLVVETSEDNTIVDDH